MPLRIISFHVVSTAPDSYQQAGEGDVLPEEHRKSAAAEANDKAVELRGRVGEGRQRGNDERGEEGRWTKMGAGGSLAPD